MESNNSILVLFLHPVHFYISSKFLTRFSDPSRYHMIWWLGWAYFMYDMCTHLLRLAHYPSDLYTIRIQNVYFNLHLSLEMELLVSQGDLPSISESWCICTGYSILHIIILTRTTKLRCQLRENYLIKINQFWLWTIFICHKLKFVLLWISNLVTILWYCIILYIVFYSECLIIQELKITQTYTFNIAVQ